MNKVVIQNIDNYVYTLNCNNKIYKINIEFYDLEKNPQVGDILLLSDKSLNEHSLNIGSLDNEAGHIINDVYDDDLVVLIRDNNKTFLKRIYG